MNIKEAIKDFKPTSREDSSAWMEIVASKYASNVMAECMGKILFTYKDTHGLSSDYLRGEVKKHIDSDDYHKQWKKHKQRAFDIGMKALEDAGLILDKPISQNS